MSSSSASMRSGSHCAASGMRTVSSVYLPACEWLRTATVSSRLLGTCTVKPVNCRVGATSTSVVVSASMSMTSPAYWPISTRSPSWNGRAIIRMNAPRKHITSSLPEIISAAAKAASEIATLFSSETQMPSSSRKATAPIRLREATVQVR